VEKWTREGRLEQEKSELDAFFTRTGYPRAPRYYVIKWLTDWVRDLGIDGYRVDTAKHFEETVSADLRKEADTAFADWKRANPDKVLDQVPFFMMGEVYGWEQSQGRNYDFGDRSVDFFAFGYDGLINFGFKREVAGSLDSLYTRYAADLTTGALRGTVLVNYIANHDDGQPFDIKRSDPIGAGTKLLLAPGATQIYYGDELARPLEIAGTQGDANLRSTMNWNDRGSERTEAVLAHWRKLAQFRQAHPAVGAGMHRRLQESPYVFSRSLDADTVLVALDQPAGAKQVGVFGMFPDGAELRDAYSGVTARVSGGSVTIDSPHPLVLLSRAR
jgi:alpha-amylase